MLINIFLWGVHMKKTTFITAGDAFITRRLPEGGYEGFEELQACIKKHDVRFLNLESTFHDYEGSPAVESGGTWARSDPRTLDDVKTYGFNIFTTANNHSGDYGEGGVLATIRHLRERDMLFSGTGKDLGEASKPCYLETKHARVALISCASSFPTASRAGAQSADMTGRPGLNPLRFNRIHHLDAEHFAMAEQVAKASSVNCAMEKSVRNGYSMPPKEGTLSIGPTKFVRDETCWVETTPNEQDMKRIEAEIREARKQADVVLVSIHNHALDYAENTQPAQFLQTFAHRCIDAGANAIIGHGPHELQGIELYNGGLILYSIGNFIFQTETVEFQPWDAYANRNMSLDTKVGAYMDDRSKNGTVGYAVQWPIWNAVMAAWTMEDGKITEVQLYPVELGMKKARSQKGVPVMNRSTETLDYLQKISEQFGTKIEQEDGVGYIRL